MEEPTSKTTKTFFDLLKSEVKKEKKDGIRTRVNKEVLTYFQKLKLFREQDELLMDKLNDNNDEKDFFHRLDRCCRILHIPESINSVEIIDLELLVRIEKSLFSEERILTV